MLLSLKTVIFSYESIIFADSESYPFCISIVRPAKTSVSVFNKKIGE